MVLTGYTDDGGYENGNLYILIIIIIIIIIIKGYVRASLANYRPGSSRPPT